MSIKDVTVREVITEEKWNVSRTGRVEEVDVELADGSLAVRYRVIAWDPGREPFVRTFFNDPVPALDFLSKLKSQSS